MHCAKDLSCVASCEIIYRRRFVMVQSFKMLFQDCSVCQVYDRCPKPSSSLLKNMYVFQMDGYLNVLAVCISRHGTKMLLGNGTPVSESKSSIYSGKYSEHRI